MGKHEARDERLTTSFVMTDEYGKAINGPTDATGARKVRKAHSAAKTSNTSTYKKVGCCVLVGALFLTTAILALNIIKMKKTLDNIEEALGLKTKIVVEGGEIKTEKEYLNAAGIPTATPDANVQKSVSDPLPITTNFDTRKVINELLDKYNVSKDVRKFFTEEKAFERFKQFKSKEQLERVFPADIFVYKMTQLTKSDSKYRLPGDDNAYLTEDEFDVICARIVLNNASAEDIYYTFGGNIPSAEEIGRGYARFQYKKYVYWMRGIERIPVEYLIDNSADIDFVNQFQDRMIEINKHANTGKPFNVEQTDEFLNYVHKKYIEGGQSVEISEGAKNLAAETYQAYYMKFINASNMEFLYIHTPEGTAFSGENLVEKDGPKSMWALLNNEPESANGISYWCLEAGSELEQNVIEARKMADNQNNEDFIDIRTYTEERKVSFGISSREENDYPKLISAEVENMYENYAYIKAITPFRFTPEPKSPSKNIKNNNGSRGGNGGSSTGGSGSATTNSNTEVKSEKIDDPTKLTGDEAAQAAAGKTAVDNEVNKDPVNLTDDQKQAIINLAIQTVKDNNAAADGNKKTNEQLLDDVQKQVKSIIGSDNFTVNIDLIIGAEEKVAGDEKQAEVKATRENEIQENNAANESKSAENAATETKIQKTENDTNNELINKSLEVIYAENQAFTDGVGTSYTDETGITIDQADPGRTMDNEIKVDWNPTSKNDSEARARIKAELHNMRRMLTGEAVNSIPPRKIVPTGNVSKKAKVFNPGIIRF